MQSKTYNFFCISMPKNNTNFPFQDQYARDRVVNEKTTMGEPIRSVDFWIKHLLRNRLQFWTVCNCCTDYNYSKHDYTDYNYADPDYADYDYANPALHLTLKLISWQTCIEYLQRFQNVQAFKSIIFNFHYFIMK